MNASMQLKILAGVIATFLGVSLWFWLAGGLGWIRGWLFIGLLAAGQTLSTLYVGRKNPELLKRRGQIGQGTKTWDLALLALFGLTYVAIPTVAALDARQGGAVMSGWLWLLGALLFVGFEVVISWTMAVNPHFEKTVRIQKDRNHQVISSGPYGIVRHPGYLATLIGFVLATPLLLGSRWSFIPALLSAGTLILRTALEDSTLRQELPGFEAYTRQVRYRLIPGLW